MTARALGATLALALSLSSCGGGDEKPERLLRIGPIEAGIAREIERDRPGTDVVEVACPDRVELKKGGRFTCMVRGSRPGEEAIATVTQVDDEGRVRYEVPGR